ncbi:YihY/virulence factor BrkB family protein [Clostridium sp.]|uniref:YihY/virulence factor BrkB family protein n=1 Tax=Clostridium sp. TaxID=1506 RepID=UPI002840630F|nr:YihY/virulence factor BrkB family protein [Clostridium sp.]MDR3593320.1 YihY/virulence factor BrkB family protein [Clostridium sp.]
MSGTNLEEKIKLLIHLIVKIKKDDVFALASQLAYYLVLSFFPFMIFLMTLIGFSSFNSGQILAQLSVMLPKSILELTKSTVREVFDNQYRGLLGISILLMVWTASSAFKAVIKSVNKAYNLKENRSFVKLSIISMIGILALAITIMLALILLVFGNVIDQYIESVYPFYKIMSILWNISRYFFIIIIMVCIFIGVYRFAPAQKLVWKEVIPGSIFSTIGWILLSFGFSFYIDNFNNYARLYGSLGAVFILMTWLFLISVIFILGVEINCVTTEFKNKNKAYSLKAQSKK